MILVNTSGDYSHTWWPLLHVPWNGWTPTDLIFPFFLFMVGLSLTFSRRSELRPAVLRAAKLIGLGLLLNLYGSGLQLEGLRYPGVLQRIGLCYLAAWAVQRLLGPRGQAAVAAGLILGYWALMTRVTGPEGYPPGLEAETNLAAQVDRLLLRGHMYWRSETWDPEGLLSTLPAIATTLLGLLAGGWLRRPTAPFPKLLGFLGGGLLLLALGVLWGEAAPAWLLFPINKALWSPSFVLLTAGLAAALFGMTWWLVDVGGLRRGTAPFVTFGRNAIAAYFASGLLAATLAQIAWSSDGGELQSLYERIYRALFASWLPPTTASAAFALTAVLLVYALARGMERRGIFLKV
jgi:predicted acyltransferase